MINIKEYTNKKISGVYKIISPSGKVYIGKSLDIRSRMSLYKNSHCKAQHKLYRSIIKYGFENHNIFILEESDDNNYLLKLEIEYKKQVIKEIGWENVLFCEIYDDFSGPKSKETIEKIRNSHKGKKHKKTHSNKGVSRPDFMNDEIRNKISKSNQKPKPPRSKEHNLKIGKTHKGMSRPFKGRESPMKNRTHSEESKEKARLNNLGKNYKHVLQYSLEGEFIKEWRGLAEACKELGFKNPSNISTCIHGKIKSAYGFKWYLKETK